MTHRDLDSLDPGSHRRPVAGLEAWSLRPRHRTGSPLAAKLVLVAALSLVWPFSPARAVEVSGVAFDPTHRVEVSGVAFDPTHRVEGRALALSGLGLHRYRLFIKLYAIALYVAPEARAAEPLTPGLVVEADVPKRLELETFWPIRAEIFRRLTRERIAQAVPADRFEELAPSIEALNALYEDVDRGDRIAITYLPGRGIELARNGVAKGVVEGESFARAMFGIWLGDRPMDSKLREELVGKAS